MYTMSLEGSRTRGDLEIESDNLLSESDEEYGEFSEASSSENDGEKREESVTVIPPTPPRPENRGVQRCLFGREKSSLIERCYTNAPNSSLHTPTIHPLPRAPKKVQSEPPKSLSSSNSAVQSQLGELLTEVRHTFKKLDDVTNRLDTVEKRLKSLEEHPTPSSSEMSDVKKQKVPPQVRVRGYQP